MFIAFSFVSYETYMNQTKTYVHIYAIISEMKIKAALKGKKFLSFNKYYKRSK